MVLGAVVFLRFEIFWVKICKQSLYKGFLLNFSKSCSTVEGEGKKTGIKLLKPYNSYAVILNSIK